MTIDPNVNDPAYRCHFHGRLVRPASLMPVRLQLFNDELHLSDATGFFVYDNDQPILVSNWHVFSGRNWQTGQPLDKKTFLTPNTVKIHCHDKLEGTSNDNIHKFVVITVPLVVGDTAQWFEHKAGQDCDIGIIRLKPLNEPATILPVNTNAKISDEHLSVGNDIMVLGFPERVSTDFGLPIWKRGTIASEPLVKNGALSKFMLDAATRQGMSGGPVVIFREPTIKILEGKLSIVDGVVGFVGIYSGRIKSSDPFAFEMGICWPAGLIDEIISDGVRAGNFKLRKLS